MQGSVQRQPREGGCPYLYYQARAKGGRNGDALIGPATTNGVHGVAFIGIDIG